jgi:hypothetical protein
VSPSAGTVRSQSTGFCLGFTVSLAAACVCAPPPLMPLWRACRSDQEALEGEISRLEFYRSTNSLSLQKEKALLREQDHAKAKIKELKVRELAVPTECALSRQAQTRDGGLVQGATCV